jgi:hypothetical protein
MAKVANFFIRRFRSMELNYIVGFDFTVILTANTIIDAANRDG